jgi:hypothetical protein
MKTAAPVLLVILSAAACDKASVVAPVFPPPTLNPPNPTGGVVGVYMATFAASPSCASELPSAARERTYTAALLSDGRIEWTGPTLNPPSGHRPISAGTFSEDAFSFFVDYERDPQSDDFHGIWDEMGGGTILNISGRGSGTVKDREITGLLNGVFAFYEPVPDPNVLLRGHYCSAADHRFRFVRQ